MLKAMQFQITCVGCGNQGFQRDLIVLKGRVLEIGQPWSFAVQNAVNLYRERQKYV
jgi:hypothetical protein